MAELKTSLNLIISFILNNELFGVEVDSVQEIIKSHEVTPVPGAPSFLEGIINLRGMIVPVLSLRKRFSLEIDESVKEKIVVVDIKGLKTGIIVDNVKEVKSIENRELKTAQNIVAGIDAQYLKGILNFDNELITVIDLDKILESDEFEARDLAELSGKEASRSFSSDMDFDDEDDDELVNQDLVVTFFMGEESIALRLDQVIEIIDLPTITPVPDAPDYICGVICQRDQIIPVIDISKIIAIEALKNTQFSDDDRSIVVSKFFNIPIALLVDKINRILPVEEKHILPLPDVFDSDFARFFKGVYNFTHIVGLTSILNIEELIPTSDQEQLLKMSQSGATEEDEEDLMEEESIMTTFRVGEDIYGVPIEKVREIINFSTVTSIPRAPDFIEGIINLRGQIIPVLDINKRFGLDVSVKTPKTRIIITQIDDKTTGIIVDEVKEVRSFPNSLFSAPPSVIKGRKNTYIESVIRLENNVMILILNINDILSKLEKEKLESFQTKGF